MRRHPALQGLSRDHHVALLHARRLRGDDPRVDPEAARSRFLRYAEAILAHHFAEEEDALLPFLGDARLRERLLREHANLRQRIARLQGADAAFQRDLGERLRAHVRFEEDELFEALQRDLGEGQWRQLDAAARQVRARARPASSGDDEPCFI